MDRRLRFFLAVAGVFAARLLFAQQWCPPGAEWYEGFSYATSNGYHHRYYDGDSTVGGFLAKRVAGESHWYSWDPPQYYDAVLPEMFTRVDDGILYIWHSQGGMFPPYWDTLAWFSAVPGDSWQVLQPEDFGCGCSYTVTDTGHVTLVGWSLRYVQTTTDCPWTGPAAPTFIERVGSMHGIFLDECQTGEPDTSLRCYQDLDLIYSTGIAPACDHVLDIDLGSIVATASIGPNPALDQIFIMLPATLQHGTVRLWDTTGRIVFGSSPLTSPMTIDISGLAQGAYECQILDRAGRVIVARRVVKQ
jgi:hypothetical protein